LLKYADSDSLPTRKAAILAMVYLAGEEEANGLIPRIIQKLEDPKEDIDVRIAAATVLGPMGTPQNKAIIDALNTSMRDTDPREAELVWSSALSLAELNQADVADTILKLLDREELSKLQYYDREKDPKNPAFRALSDQEQQRILINTMLGAKKLEVPAVQSQLKKIALSDPSPRVRAAGMEILGPQ
jgi:HEAT repeat protein